MKREPTIASVALMILALVLAIALWIYITKELGPEGGIEEKVFRAVEVKVLFSAKKRVAAEVIPETIKLRITAAKSVVKRLDEDEILAFIDASTFEVGRYKGIPIRLIFPEDVNPEDIKVTKEPSVCEIMLEVLK